MRNEGKYDFSAFGRAIKEARESKGWTRERLAQEIALAPRYIMSIENKGQHPSFQVFYELVTLFHISVDQFFFPDTGAEKTTRRRQLESQLDGLEEADLIIHRKGNTGSQRNGRIKSPAFFFKESPCMKCRNLIDCGVFASKSEDKLCSIAGNLSCPKTAFFMYFQEVNSRNDTTSVKLISIAIKINLITL